MREDPEKITKMAPPKRRTHFFLGFPIVLFQHWGDLRGFIIMFKGRSRKMRQTIRRKVLTRCMTVIDIAVIDCLYRTLSTNLMTCFYHWICPPRYLLGRAPACEAGGPRFVSWSGREHS